MRNVLGYPQSGGDLQTQIYNLRKYCVEIAQSLETVIEEIQMNKSSDKAEKSPYELPKGTIILSYKPIVNGGLEYGTWQQLQGTVTIGDTALIAYVRTI